MEYPTVSDDRALALDAVNEVGDDGGVTEAPAISVGAAWAALEAREGAFREAVWRSDELLAMVDAVRGELAALHRKLAEAEETIAELTDIGDAAQLAIDRLRREAASQEKAARQALAQRNALAAELFEVARHTGGMIGDEAYAAEVSAQRDALALEYFRLVKRNKPGWFHNVWLRLLPRRLRFLLQIRAALA